MQNLFNRAYQRRVQVQVPEDYAIPHNVVNVLTLHSDSHLHLSLIVGYIAASRNYTAYAESLKLLTVEYLHRNYYRGKLINEVKRYQEALNSLNEYERLKHSKDISLDPYQINKYNDMWGY